MWNSGVYNHYALIIKHLKKEFKERFLYNLTQPQNTYFEIFSETSVT